MFAKKRAHWLEKLRSKEIVNTDLHNAILTQRPNDVKRALLKGADPNSRNSTTDEPAIFPVCARGNIEITKILLNGGADPNIIFKMPLQPRLVPLVIAVIYNRTAICKILLANGADPNGPPELDDSEKLIRQEEKPVYHAAMGWRISISQVLLKGEWKKLYYENVKRILEDLPIVVKMPPLSSKTFVLQILDFLRLLDVELDIHVITDAETWNHMEDEHNPTLKHYGSYNTKRNLEHLLDDDDHDELARTNNDTSIHLREADIYGDVMKLLDASD